MSSRTNRRIHALFLIMISFHLNLPAYLAFASLLSFNQEMAEASLFSIDGRVVSTCSAENITGVGFSMTLGNSSGFLPYGCYVILLKDGDDIILKRKVLVID